MNKYESSAVIISALALALALLTFSKLPSRLSNTTDVQTVPAYIHKSHPETLQLRNKLGSKPFSPRLWPTSPMRSTPIQPQLPSHFISFHFHPTKKNKAKNSILTNPQETKKILHPRIPPLLPRISEYTPTPHITNRGVQDLISRPRNPFYNPFYGADQEKGEGPRPRPRWYTCEELVMEVCSVYLRSDGGKRFGI
ncbi:uncharacterized protein EAF01_002734 [Botrytis porri]|uniref:uncharacterized protein n=1 Tax=Botrytis porri TaxID=87229 RepID=UPI0018FF9EFB|nr:uncharacterized protein EAF01_002734 [Botrytis porri]KAF7911226.1 hypothetical protein EAF01_002734 [Botrytis porri]